MSCFLISVLLGCSDSIRNDVEVALEMAGERRCELLYVLNQYADNPATGRHLKAAEFLIANMVDNGYWKSLEGDSLRWKVDSMYPEMPPSIRRVIYSLINDLLPIETMRLFVPDIQTISASFLIEHINNRIQMLDSCPWLQQLTFEEFCNYLLPYRVANEFPVQSIESEDYVWRGLL